MIEEIVINEVATYRTAPSVMRGLEPLNFVFGANGTGKTTIGRIIRDQETHSSCEVKWKGDARLAPLVYNRDFVSENFSESKDLKGVFTLGEKHVAIKESIDAAKIEFNKLLKIKASLEINLLSQDPDIGKIKQLSLLEQACKDKCWTQKIKHDSKFSPAFEGFRNNQEKFKIKTLTERGSNAGTAQSLENLELRAETLFGETPILETPYQIPSFSSVSTHEANPILAKRVIGSDDVDIAKLINKLNNSDWVKQGRAYYSAEDKICPFCQQTTNESLKASLDEYFDETFEADIESIKLLKTNISADYTALRLAIATVIESDSKYLDREKFRLAAELINAILSGNLQSVENKVKEPSARFVLESTAESILEINNILQSANVEIAKHNEMVSNLESERSQLISDIWQFIIGVEIKEFLDHYDTQKTSFTKAIDNIKLQIAKNQDLLDQKQYEITLLESQATGVDPSIISINSLLSSFGFTGFRLQKVEQTNSYRLIRDDGSAAQSTLSEGEKTFVTFLYFYQLLSGSADESGITNDRIVVFDDPVSSLDSDILFIVSSLIKGLYQGIAARTGTIRQIFVLTHNVYFHKEITYIPKRTSGSMPKVTYWIVRKSGRFSDLTLYHDNPVSTSYELLWGEVRRADTSSLTIRNTLRRIIENYFKIWGHIDFDKICDKFEGTDKLICRSLFSWVHDGSHFMGDDLYISVEPSQIERYFQVFRRIFEKMDHISHYKMMMGPDFVEQTSEPELQEIEMENTGTDVALAG